VTKVISVAVTEEVAGQIAKAVPAASVTIAAQDPADGREDLHVAPAHRAAAVSKIATGEMTASNVDTDKVLGAADLQIVVPSASKSNFQTLT
jgi:hypothetical protein